MQLIVRLILGVKYKWLMEIIDLHEPVRLQTEKK
jgi:hypothetical protein